jgi:Co/Zn/Cd efflux system component
MSGCCQNGCEITARNERQRTTLKWVLSINAVMFLVIVAAALYADSTALLSDSLDNLGDAITYALSLNAIALGGHAKAKVALFKGMLILAAALAVAGQIAWKLAHPALPIFEAMGAFSLLGLAANGICLYLLWRHRHEDVNMSSVWECSRNDIASNISVFVAALGVWATGAAWPDLLVAAALVVLLLRSALRVISSARRELHAES